MSYLRTKAWLEPGTDCCCSVAKPCPTLRPRELQHTRLPCPSISKLSPRVRSNSCTLNQWLCLTISSSAALFSFCLQSFMAPKSFPVSQLFASGGQSIGDSASASICPVIIRGWFPFGLTDLISWNWCNSPWVPVWTFPVVANVNSCDAGGCVIWHANVFQWTSNEVQGLPS